MPVGRHDRTLELLKKLNGNVVTKSVAEDGKWAAEMIELLIVCIAACPARDYWKQLQLKDARIRQLLGRAR